MDCVATSGDRSLRDEFGGEGDEASGETYGEKENRSHRVRCDGGRDLQLEFPSFESREGRGSRSVCTFAVSE